MFRRAKDTARIERLELEIAEARDLILGAQRHIRPPQWASYDDGGYLQRTADWLERVDGIRPIAWVEWHTHDLPETRDRAAFTGRDE